MSSFSIFFHVVWLYWSSWSQCETTVLQCRPKLSNSFSICTMRLNSEIRSHTGHANPGLWNYPVFIYGLFSSAVNIWNYTASKYSYWWMSEWMWKDVTGSGYVQLWDIPESFWAGGGTKETHENLSLSIWFPSRDSNQTHTDYKSELLSPKPGVHKYITHLKVLGPWRGNMKFRTDYPLYKL
jgi:hypothetical protein